MKNFKEFITEAKSPSKFEDFLRSAIKSSASKGLANDEKWVEEQVTKVVKWLNEGAVMDALDKMPINMEKMTDELKRKGYETRDLHNSKEAGKFIMDMFSKKGAWKRFSLKTLDLG